MSKLDKFEYDFMRSIFNGIAHTNWSATAGSTLMWLGLHTADPGDSGTTAAEGGYTAYTRISIARSSTGWAVTSGSSNAAASVSPVAAITFPQVATTSTGTFTHATVYPASDTTGPEGAYNGTLTPNINFSQNVTPSITTGSSITET